MGKTTLSSPPASPKKENYFVRNFMVCLFIVSIWDIDSIRFSIPDCFSVREAVEKKTGGNMRREMSGAYDRNSESGAYNRNL